MKCPTCGQDVPEQAKREPFAIQVPAAVFPEGIPLPDALLKYAGSEMVEVTTKDDLARGYRVLHPKTD